MYLECLPNDYIQRVFIEISILSHPSKGKNIFPVRIFWFDLSNTDLTQKNYDGNSFYKHLHLHCT